MRLFWQFSNSVSLALYKYAKLTPTQSNHNFRITTTQHSLVVKLDKAGWPSMDIKYDLRLPMQIQCREKTFKERINQKATGISFQWF